MAYTIAQAKDDLEGVLKGTSVNKITNIYPLLDRAGRQVLEDVDPQETKRRAQIANAIYDSVYDYAAPTDLKGNKIIDIRPQVNRALGDNFSQVYSEEFDLRKLIDDNLLQVTFNQGVKTIRIKKALTGAITVNEVDSITGNGTWAGAGSVTNLSNDSLNYVSGGGSLKFDLLASASGTLTNSTFSVVDLSAHENESALFLWVYIPDTTIITSFTLRWGSSALSYWSDSATAPHTGSFVNGWNLVRFDWNGATQTLTPNSAAINYLQLIIASNGTADTDLRLDNVVSNLGKIFDIEYYSKFPFANSAGTWQERTTADTDTVNLDVESYNLFLFKAAEFASQQSEMSKDDTNYFEKEYFRALNRYKGMYKSEIQKPRGYYYRMR